MTFKRYEPKPLFLERMKQVFNDEKEFEKYLEVIKKGSLNSIRCNTLKINPDELKKRLETKGWKIKQLFKEYPEIMIIEEKLLPGELGRSLEHLLGYYYVQDISSMLSILALNPKSHESFLDLCSAPGSKTTQAAAKMENKGIIVANEVKFDRLSVLASNLERCGVSNCIITKKDGINLCESFRRNNILFDKILVDAPCSGEGTIISNPKTMQMWNFNMIRQLSKLQKSLLLSALSILKPNGELVYSTCTHSPEEDEEVVDFALQNYPDLKIEKISLPVICRSGICKWQDKKFNKELNKACRIYPQDNNTEGFFIVKMKKGK
ncbi:MAG: RsmB/NOP family class I SAM-dependent RNA methyltransferase [archaeon]|nr:RsmB/NOP family class I SAM-dependent RNA methyltransferase [archaeon]